MIKAAVIGATGYVGAELTAILAAHPQIATLTLFSSGEGDSATPFAQLYPQFRNVVPQSVTPFAPHKISDIDVVFLATPHELAMALSPSLLAAGKVVIDLSAAFRLKDAALYDSHYGFAHTSAALLQDAVYGLPELVGDALKNATLIACAGCYVTAASLALAPLQQAGLLNDVTPIISAVSGVSGAGKKPTATTAFCEVSLAPYGVHGHRHQPEIEQNLGRAVVFTPHLGNYKRGILASCYAFLKPGVSAAQVDAAFQTFFAGASLVRLYAKGKFPAVQNVEKTPFVDIGWSVDEARGQISVFSALDNLLKGAASQAVQCLNRRYGWADTLGLLPASASGVQA